MCVCVLLARCGWRAVLIGNDKYGVARCLMVSKNDTIIVNLNFISTRENATRCSNAIVGGVFLLFFVVVVFARVVLPVAGRHQSK